MVFGSSHSTLRASSLAAAALAVLSMGTPLILAVLSDRLVAVAQNHNTSGSWVLLAVTLVIVLVSLVLCVLVQARAERNRQEVLVRAQTEATERVLALVRTPPAGTIKERLVDDLSDIVTMRVQTVPQLAVTGVVMIVSLIWVARISPWALAWAVAGSLATVIPAWAVKRWAERAYEDTTDIEAAIDSEYFQARDSLDLVHTERLQAYVRARVRRLDDLHLRIGTLAEASGAAQWGLSNLVQVTALYGSLLLVLWLVSTERIPFTEAAGAVIVLRSFFGLVGSGADSLTDIWVNRRREARLARLLRPAPLRPLETSENALLLHGFTVRAGGKVRSRVPVLRLGVGEDLRVVGPNGAGKSLMLRGVVGLADADGIVASVLPADGLRAGYLPQHDPLLTLTPAELFDDVAATGGDAERAHTALAEILGGEEAARIVDVPIADLSGGQRKTVLIAEAIGSSQGVLLLDEPDAHLSAEAARRLAGLLTRLDDAVLVVAHTPHFGAFWAAPELRVARPEEGR